MLVVLSCLWLQPTESFCSVTNNLAVIGNQSAQQHNTAQHNTAQHDTAQHSTAQHSIAHDSTAQHNTTQYSTAQPGVLKKHPLSPPLLLTHSMKCKSVSVLHDLCLSTLLAYPHLVLQRYVRSALWEKDRKTKEAPQGSFLFEPVPLQSRSQKNSRARVLLQRVLLQSTRQKYQRAMAQRGNLLLQSKGRAKLSRTVLHPSCTAVVYLRLAMATKANNC